MSHADVAYSCGSCGYPLNLTSSNRITSGIGSDYQKSIKKGVISFISVDLSRFTQVDEINCFPINLGRYRPKTKLLCRKCGAFIGHGYDNGLTQVSTGCNHLVSITLYRCNIKDVGLESLAKYCRALEHVNLSYCILISDRGISAISRGCLRLHTFMISYCKGLTGMGFKGCSSTLTYLEADSCMLTPEGLLEAVSGGGLEYLNVSNLRNWVGMDGLGGIGAGSATRLRFLNLRMCRFVGDESVAAIAKGCPLLEEWSVAVCHEIHISGWSAMGSYCGNLKILHVNRCRNLCDRGLQALRDGCGQLEVLYMHGCRKVTYVGLETFKIQRQDVEIRREECVSIGPCMDDLFA